MLIAIAAVSIACTSPHISDGDTITCAGQRVRLFGINAPELSHPDLGIAEEPGGREASDRLLALTRERVTCTVAGNQYDRYCRMVAKCGTAQTPDLGAEMVREGLACQWVRYSSHEYDGLGRDCDRRGKLKAGLTKRQKDVLDAIRELTMDGISPTYVRAELQTASAARLRGVIEEAANALAAQIGQAGAADILSLVLENRRKLARA